MALEMVLNDLSMQCADSIITAREWMATFQRTAWQATAIHHVSRVIRTRESIYSVILAQDYPLSRWCNDSEVDRESRMFIRSLTSKAPYCDDIPELSEKMRGSDFLFGKSAAEGLGVAYLLETLAISLPSEKRWDAAHLSIEFQALKEVEGEPEIEETTETVFHASQPVHVDEHTEWIQGRLRRDIKDGPDLWNRRIELFPALEFCDSARSQVQDLHPIILQSVSRRLSELETYCQSWTVGPFDPQRLPTKATLESESTLNRFGSQRTFLCPDGQLRVFSWHVRLTPNAWRIHFFPGPQPGSMIIGYIGPHLPTARSR